MIENDSYSEFIGIILDSRILSEHRAIDPELDRLLAIIGQSPANWKNLGEVHISSPSNRPNSTQLKIFQRRLKFSPNTPETQQVRTALALLVDYLSTYPNDYYQVVHINCSHKSYSIFCGLTDAGVNAVCVMVGDRIPEYAFKKSAE